MNREEKKVDNYKIYEALVVIRDVCRLQEGCHGCPMGDSSGECHLSVLQPENWKLKEPDEVVRLME